MESTWLVFKQSSLEVIRVRTTSLTLEHTHRYHRKTRRVGNVSRCIPSDSRSNGKIELTETLEHVETSFSEFQLERDKGTENMFERETTSSCKLALLLFVDVRTCFGGDLERSNGCR